MSLVPGDYGSYIRRQQSFGPMGPIMTQLPTDGSYANRRYQMPFVRQAPMMDMRGIGGLFTSRFGGLRGGFGGGYSMPSAYMSQRRRTQEYRPEDGPPQRSLEERQQMESALAAGADPAARLGGTIGANPPPQGGFGQSPGPVTIPGFTPPPDPFGPPLQADEVIRRANRQGMMFGQPLMGNTSQPQGGFGQPPMGGAPGGKGGAKGGGTFGQPSYGMQARYSSPFGNLF